MLLAEKQEGLVCDVIVTTSCVVLPLFYPWHHVYDHGRPSFRTQEKWVKVCSSFSSPMNFHMTKGRYQFIKSQQYQPKTLSATAQVRQNGALFIAIAGCAWVTKKATPQKRTRLYSKVMWYYASPTSDPTFSQSYMYTFKHFRRSPGVKATFQKFLLLNKQHDPYTSVK